jgi:hypothetical protein
VRLFAVLLSALAVTGCSIQVNDQEPQKTVTQQGPRTVTERTVEKQPAPPQTTSPDVPSGTVEEAVARVRREGFDVPDTGTYRPENTLRVLIGVRSDSATAYNQNAFFFLGGRYLGTDTKQVSAGIDYVGQTDLTVTLRYAIYAPDDPNCCPSGGAERVRYRWNGSRLTPLDPIPSESPDAPRSRR